MIKFITTNLSRAHGQFGKFFLLSPECLDRLNQQALAENPSFKKISGDFSLAVSEIRIGGTYRKTNPNRLRQSTPILLDLLVQKNVESPLILDLGISDGILTLELFEKLSEKYPKTKIYAADINLSLERFRYGFLLEYRAENGEPILVKFGGLGLQLAKHRHEFDFAISYLAQKYLNWHSLRQKLRPDGLISLLNPFVLKSKNIVPIKLDCLEYTPEFENLFDAIRAGNILNLSYFPRNQINTAVAHIFKYLKNGGVLIVSKNESIDSADTENGSVWLKQSEGFVWQTDFGHGSEIKNIVNEFCP
jgi:SAM-dependent methyltransferase